MTEHGEVSTLLQRWRAGDAAALEELLDGHLAWITSYVHGRLGRLARQRAETQDFVQAAMMDFLAHGPRVEIASADAFRALLARIAENGIRDHHRYHGRQRRAPWRELQAPASATDLDPVRQVTRPSQHVQREEHAALVRLALELLAPEDREVIWLREFEELAFAEVGARMELSEDAARMRFARALPRLAEKVASLRSRGVDASLGDG